MSISFCALCQKHRNLEDSHLIPKWAYKRLQKADAKKKEPIHVTDGSAFNSSIQTKQYLLCKECEDRFSRREDYVSRLTTAASGKLKIVQYVNRLDTPNKKLVELSDQIDTIQLSYFAASIIWRSHVMDRGCRLGVYSEHFRRYLLEEESFPLCAVLCMGILEPTSNFETPHNWVTEPSSLRAGPLWLHSFMICGLIFRCFVGQALKPETRQVCLARSNQKKYAVLQPAEQFGDFQSALDMLIAAKPRGKIATN